MTTSLSHLIRSQKDKKIVFVGVGNRLRGDDGAGPAFIEMIRRKTDIVCINAETVPENYIGTIQKNRPDMVVFIDTMELETDPGKFVLTQPSKLGWNGFSTHATSLNMLSEILTTCTGAEIIVLGIQPEQCNFGAEISSSVRNTLRELMKVVCTSL